MYTMYIPKQVKNMKFQKKKKRKIDTVRDWKG